MKFSCTKENLARGLGAVCRVASRNMALPILNNVLIDAANGSLTLCTTNLELAIKVKVRAMVKQDGRYTIQSRVLNDFVSVLPEDKIDAEVDERGMKFIAGQSVTNFKGQSAEEFPVMPVTETKTEAMLPSTKLKSALEDVIFAAANDESRPEISGIYWHLQENNLVLAATDSYRLSERRLSLTEPVQEEQSVIIPARAAQELLRVLPSEDTPVRIALGDKQASFYFDDIELVTREIDGQYPDYQQIIPKQWLTLATCSKPTLIDNIKAASFFCQPGVNDINLVVDTKNNALKISAANAQLGEHHSSIDIKTEGEDKEIVFNYRYLLDGIQSLDGDEIRLELGDSQAPGLIKGAKDEDGLYLLMPIRQ